MKMILITVKEVQIEEKVQVFILKLIDPFKKQGIAITTAKTKIYDAMTIFSCVSFYNDKN